MHRNGERPTSDVAATVAFLMDRRLHPDWHAVHVRPWEQLIEHPTWRTAKTLLAVDPERVSAVVERLVAMEHGSHDPHQWMCLGKVRQFLGDHERAIEAFQRLVWRDGDIRALYNIGLCLQAMGQTEQARRTFLEILESHPRDDRALRALGELAA